jgi:hypothetical protein
MNAITSPRFLPAVLWADAASCAATGALQLAAAPLLARWFGLDAVLLMVTGALLLAVAAFGALLARSAPIPRAGVWVLIAGNLGWLLGCAELLFTGAGGNTLGQAWIVLQAIVVGVLAELEWTALRRAPRAAWA